MQRCPSVATLLAPSRGTTQERWPSFGTLFSASRAAAQERKNLEREEALDRFYEQERLKEKTELERDESEKE